MSHPCVHYVDTDSPPRMMMSGDQILLEHMPAGTRCIYAKPPIQGLRDPDAAIRYALNHPIGSDPLHALLWPGMKVTIAFDDISLPLPPMRRPDIRQRVIEIVLEILGDHWRRRRFFFPVQPRRRRPRWHGGARQDRSG